MAFKNPRLIALILIWAARIKMPHDANTDGTFKNGRRVEKIGPGEVVGKRGKYTISCSLKLMDI